MAYPLLPRAARCVWEVIRGLAASRDTRARLSILRFDGKFARYEMSLKEKAVKHKVLDMERRKVQVHVRVRQKLTVLLTLATGAGHWG